MARVWGASRSLLCSSEGTHHRCCRLNPSVRPNPPTAMTSDNGSGSSSSHPSQDVSSQASNPSSDYSPPRDERSQFEASDRSSQKHEFVAAGVAAEFISCILDMYPAKRRAEYQIAPSTRNIQRRPLACTAQDDGSIVMDVEGASRITLAMVKAKKSRYRGMGRSHPPPDVVGQQASEMLSLCLDRFDESSWKNSINRRDYSRQ
jgi:hypothetical protein